MSSLSRKIQKNSEDFMIKEYYKNMTPEMYQEGINRAIKIAEETCLKRYQAELSELTRKYNEAILNSTLIAMDTLATEMIYELGNMLECYVEAPEYLDQKVDIVQKLYETAMTSIEDYATDKYENDKAAQKEYKRKKQTIQRIFGMEGSENYGKKKSK